MQHYSVSKNKLDAKNLIRVKEFDFIQKVMKDDMTELVSLLKILVIQYLQVWLVSELDLCKEFS